LPKNKVETDFYTQCDEFIRSAYLPTRQRRAPRTGECSLFTMAISSRTLTPRKSFYIFRARYSADLFTSDLLQASY
jgi:hypothetical protein